MLYALILFAQQEQEQAPPQGNPYSPLIMMGLIFLLGYFLLMRPAQKQEKERRALIAKLKKNDRIINSGGIIGTVDSIKEQDDEVILKGGVHILRSSIVKIVNSDEANKEGDK
jgi:preprotein translocase subunit YajC